MVVVLLAEGFEEIEALTPVDILRRAGARVCVAGVGGKEITGSHGIAVTADAEAGEIDLGQVEAIVLPGGLPGTPNLEKSPAVQALIDHCAEQGKLIAAICAAPSILAHKGLLKGREATAFPTFREDLSLGGATVSTEPVVQDGNFITGRGMGVATQFGLKLAEVLVSPEKSAEIRKSIQWQD